MTLLWTSNGAAVIEHAEHAYPFVERAFSMAMLVANASASARASAPTR